MFHFHNERNRLLTLLRCAPTTVALGQLGRFGLTTLSLATNRAFDRVFPTTPISGFAFASTSYWLFFASCPGH